MLMDNDYSFLVRDQRIKLEYARLKAAAIMEAAHDYVRHLEENMTEVQQAIASKRRILDTLEYYEEKLNEGGFQQIVKEVTLLDTLLAVKQKKIDEKLITIEGFIEKEENRRKLLTKFSFPKSEVSVRLGKTYRQSPVVSPTGTRFVWSVTNEGVATVDEKGTVTAKYPGSCNVVVTASDGSKGIYLLTVSS